jgi:hypothetical protein
MRLTTIGKNMGHEMIERDVNVTGRSGAIPSFAVCPDGPEAFPGIILYMDAPGIPRGLAQPGAAHRQTRLRCSLRSTAGLWGVNTGDLKEAKALLEELAA